jgi:hypothetical protein
MNNRHSVELVRSLRNKLESKPEGLWCVALSTKGQILKLKSIDINPSTDIFVQSLCFRSAIENENGPLIIVHKGLSHHLFDERDWLFIDRIKSHVSFSEKIFDYIKICADRSSLLSNHEIL